MFGFRANIGAATLKQRDARLRVGKGKNDSAPFVGAAALKLGPPGVLRVGHVDSAPMRARLH